MSNRIVGGCMIAAGVLLTLTVLGGGLCVGILSLGGGQADGLIGAVVTLGFFLALSIGLIIGGFKVEKQGRDVPPSADDEQP